MKIENTKLIAAFVVPVLIIAGMVGYQLYRQDEIPIEVDEGYAEITVTVPPYPEMESYNQTTTATTYINGKNNTLELTVHPMFWKAGMADIRIYVASELEPEFEPTNLIIQSRILDAPDVNKCNMVFAYSPDLENLTLWPHSKNTGPASGERICFIGYDVIERNFELDNLILDVRYIPFYYYQESLESPITVEITAVLTGFSEEIKSIAHISYVPNGGVMNMDFK